MTVAWDVLSASSSAVWYSELSLSLLLLLVNSASAIKLHAINKAKKKNLQELSFRYHLVSKDLYLLADFRSRLSVDTVFRIELSRLMTNGNSEA